MVTISNNRRLELEKEVAAKAKEHFGLKGEWPTIGQAQAWFDFPIGRTTVYRGLVSAGKPVQTKKA